MKKRIGTKIYDTDKAVLVLSPDLYKKQSAFEFFRFDGKTITPVSFEDAETIIQSSNDANALQFLSRKHNKQGYTHIAIGTEYANRLATYCRSHGVTQKDVIEGFISTLKE